MKFGLHAEKTRQNDIGQRQKINFNIVTGLVTSMKKPPYMPTLFVNSLEINWTWPLIQTRITSLCLSNNKT